MVNQDGSELTRFKMHMRSIRSSDYRAAFEHIRTDLGLSKEVDDSEIEAFLIYATRDCLGKSLDADMVLAAFGLLKGFDNQHHPDKTMGSDALITARRRKFIKESSYVAVKHGPHRKRCKAHYNSYNELVAAGEDAIKEVICSLGSADGELINRVAQKIYSYKKQIAFYLEKSKEYLDIDKDGRTIGVKLQDLINVNQDEILPGKDNADGQNPKDNKEDKEEDKEIADELLTQIKPKNKDGINKYIQSLDNYVEEVRDDAGKIIDYIPKERVTFLVTEDDALGEEPIGPEKTDKHGTFEEEEPEEEPEGEPSQPWPCPSPQPPSATIPGAKEKGAKTPSLKVFAVIVSVFLIVSVTLTIGYQGLRQQQHQKELELLRELFRAPSGSEIEITESNSLSIGDAEYKMETTVTIRTPEIPDTHSESIVGEEFTGPFSVPLD